MNCTKKSCEFYRDGRCRVGLDPNKCGLLSPNQLKAHPPTTAERMSRDKIAGLEREIAALKAENTALKVWRANQVKERMTAFERRYLETIAGLEREIKALKIDRRKVR